MLIQDVKPELQPISQLWRHVLDTHTGTMHAHMIARRAMEYPTVNPDLSGMPFLHALPNQLHALSYRLHALPHHLHALHTTCVQAHPIWKRGMVYTAVSS